MRLHSATGPHGLEVPFATAQRNDRRELLVSLSVDQAERGAEEEPDGQGRLPGTPDAEAVEAALASLQEAVTTLYAIGLLVDRVAHSAHWSCRPRIEEVASELGGALRQVQLAALRLMPGT